MRYSEVSTRKASPVSTVPSSTAKGMTLTPPRKSRPMTAASMTAVVPKSGCWRISTAATPTSSMGRMKPDSRLATRSAWRTR